MSKMLKASVAALALTAMFTGAARAQETIKLTFVSGYAPSFTWPRAFQEYFGPEVNKRLAENGNAYQIDWNYAHSGTIAKPGGEMDAMETGLGDLGVVIAPLHVDQVPLYNIAYVTPFSSVDIHFLQETYQRIYEEFSDAFDADWEAVNQVALTATGPLPDYWVISTRKVETVDDLKGMKIAAIGPNLRWVAPIGAVGVNAPASEWYQQINTGIVEGAIAWADVAGAQKLCEPAKFAVDASIGGVVAHVLTVNLDTWNGLPDQVRDVMREVAPDYARYQADLAVQGRDRGTKFCVEEMGLEITKMDADQRVAWANGLPPLAKEWADDMDASGRPGSAILARYMEILREAAQPIARNWDAE
jgi:TRAP-type C4-dicarboxylate transport system substrate-binding protein